MSATGRETYSHTKRINSSRYLVYSSPLSLPTAVTLSTPPQTTLSGTATSRRIDRKRRIWLNLIARGDLVSLGTVDITPATLIPSFPSATRKRDSPSSSSSVSSPPSKKQALDPTSLPFKVIIAPRPSPPLPLFHPANTLPLPTIAQPRVLPPSPVNPSNPPRRSSGRARKPAAKALALSLGQGSDGSGFLDTANTANKDTSSVDGAVVRVEDRSRRSTSSSSKLVKDEIGHIPSAVNSIPSNLSSAPVPTPKTRRGGLKRKVSQVDPSLEDDLGGAVTTTQATKRPRRSGIHNSDVLAPVHAPSPLAKEVARASPQSPVQVVKKKSHAASSTSSLSPPPQQVVVMTAPVPKINTPVPPTKPQNTSAATTSPKPAAKHKDAVDHTKTRMRSNSSTLSTVSEQPKTDVDDPEAPDSKKSKSPATGEADDENGDDGDDDGDDRIYTKINIFQQPIELKPRPRPTYKMHLKRISSASVMDDLTGSGARKRSASRSHSRKGSKATNPTTATPSPNKDMFLSEPRAECNMPNGGLAMLIDGPFVTEPQSATTMISTTTMDIDSPMTIAQGMDTASLSVSVVA